MVRSTDTLTRTGGDEFLLVLVECDRVEAERVVRRMIADTPDGVACSAGLARWEPPESATHLIERADRALYSAKVRGPVVIAAELGAGPKPRWCEFVRGRDRPVGLKRRSWADVPTIFYTEIYEGHRRSPGRGARHLRRRDRTGGLRRR